MFKSEYDEIKANLIKAQHRKLHTTIIHPIKAQLRKLRPIKLHTKINTLK